MEKSGQTYGHSTAVKHFVRFVRIERVAGVQHANPDYSTFA